MLVHWLYVAIVRPMIFLASLVWWPGCQAHSSKKKLSKIQISVCLGIRSAILTTPTGVMEVLVGPSPLDLVIQWDARSAAHRPWSLECWPYVHSQLGHSCILTRLQKSDPIFNMRLDVIRSVLIWNPNIGLLC
jgi:hypothetical protein